MNGFHKIIQMKDRKIKELESELERLKNKPKKKVYSNPQKRSKSGKRKDIDNIFFRSAAEANYARFLKFSGKEFLYEKKTFYFEKIKRGSISYTPDFYLPSEDQYIEFKGWLDGKSKTKLKRFKKYYPKEFSKMIIAKQGLNQKGIQELLAIGFRIDQIVNYKDVEEWKRIIPEWE